MGFRNSWLQWMPTLALLAIASGLAAQQPAPAQVLTIERIANERDLSKAKPRDPVWCPDGKTLSFIRTPLRAPKAVHGPTNPPPLATQIFSMDAATAQEKVLVSNAELTNAFGVEHPHLGSDEEMEAASERRHLKGYLWAPSGHALVLASGTALVWFDLDTRVSKTLVSNGKDIDNPEISPNGRFVSFIQDHTLWLADASTGAAHALSRAGSSDLLEGEPDWAYFHELGLKRAYWWSPDSSSIVWLETDDRAVDKYSLRSADGEEQQMAYPKPGGAIPKVRLLVRAVSGGKSTQIDLGSDTNIYVPDVKWSPDGKHLAIERLGRSQKNLDLLLADPVTGKSHTIVSEQDVYWVNRNDGAHFLKDSRRFLLSSERSGYRHLYLYDLSGHQLAQLTQGNWEVTALTGVDEVAGVVYFTATEASPLERQLYRVNLDGSGFERVTHEKGTHDVLFAGSGNVFLDTWSDHSTPPQEYLMRADGSRIGNIASTSADNEKFNQPSPLEFLTVKTHLGIDLNAWMMKPPGFDPTGHYPAIVYVAGGPEDQIVRDVWGGDISLWFAFMAQKGYVVFAMDNRGTAGRGHLFEEPVHLRFSGTEMADQRDGVLYLRSQPWIDKTRIGICGWGYGGDLALHGMLDRPLLFKAGFAGSPITDWHLYDAVFTERYLEDPTRNQDGWLASSPVENAKNLNGPLLLAQATLDEKIHLENSLTLLDELLDHGKYADILLFPDRKNLFEERGTRLILFQRLTDFFLKNL